MEIQRRRKRRRDETSSLTAWESPWYVRREKREPGKVAIFQGKEADVIKSTKTEKKLGRRIPYSRCALSFMRCLGSRQIQKVCSFHGISSLALVSALARLFSPKVFKIIPEQQISKLLTGREPTPIQARSP